MNSNISLLVIILVIRIMEIIIRRITNVIASTLSPLLPRLGVAYGLNFVELLVAAAMPCSAARAKV